MAREILQVDWIFIDSVIIFLLFLLLISVRIFKSTHRWRSSFSNEALKQYTFSELFKNTNSQIIQIKQWSLTINTSLPTKKNNYPLIVILQTMHKKRFCKIITEGLGSFGINTINLRVKITDDSYSEKAREKINYEIKYSLSLILDLINQEELIENSDYFLILCTKSLLPVSVVFSDSKNKGILLINPKITKKKIIFIKEVLANSEQFKQVSYIFSEKNFLMKNRSLSNFKTEFESLDSYEGKVSTVEKANKNYKYYETILLGKIIDKLESKQLKP
ncbi:MAG: hypothetical protein ACXABO_08475 [Promethearchaeota archaeon]|jgi:hypothetical protein